MSISPFQAAKFLSEISDWRLSNLELNKIIYMSHMAYLGSHDGEPLVNENFEAWMYGPVLPSLYHKAKGFGSASVKNIFRRVPDIENEAAKKALRSMYEQIGSWRGDKLVALTHRQDGAWSKSYSSGRRNSIISNNLIKEEFSELFDAD